MNKKPDKGVGDKPAKGWTDPRDGKYFPLFEEKE